MEFLEAVFAVAAGGVDPAVDGRRRVGQVGHDKARVVAQGFAGMRHDFGLDDDAPGVRPRLGATRRLGVDPSRGAGGGRLLSDGIQRVGRRREQHRILGHRDDVLDMGGLEQVEDLRGGEAAVQADAQPRVRKGGPQLRQQAQQQPGRPDA